MKRTICAACGKSLEETNATEHIDCHTLPSFLDYFLERLLYGKKKKGGCS